MLPGKCGGVTHPTILTILPFWPLSPSQSQPHKLLLRKASNMEGHKYAQASLASTYLLKSLPSRPTTSPATSTTLTSTLFTFLALYLTTLFSLDTWAAARGSPYRAPGNNNSFYRPTVIPPAPDSYQGSMHGRGNAGPGSGNQGGRNRDVGRVAQARDSRPPIKMGGTAGCGACLT
jgi:hypothetical protein